MRILREIAWFFLGLFGYKSKVAEAIKVFKRYKGKEPFLCNIHGNFNEEFDLKKVLKLLNKEEVREEFRKKTNWKVNSHWNGECNHAITYIRCDGHMKQTSYFELKLIHLKIAKKYEL